MAVCSQHHALAALLLERVLVPIVQGGTSGLQDQSGLVQKILPQFEFDPWTIHPIVSHYTDSLCNNK